MSSSGPMAGRQTRNSQSAACFGEESGAVQNEMQASGPSGASPSLVSPTVQLSPEVLEAIKSAATEAAIAAVGAVAAPSNSVGSGSGLTGSVASSGGSVPSSSSGGPISVATSSLAARTSTLLASGSGFSSAEPTGMLSSTVPPFLSTFSLPATSSSAMLSAPLATSVVPGTGVGGALTGLSSQLDKFFVVGPGYSPVPPKLVNQILAGKYIDLCELLSQNLLQAQAEPQLLFDGRLVLTSTGKKPRRQIEDIVTWTEAFTIYTKVLASTFSHRWRDLTAYKLLILRTYRQFGGQAWLTYDQAFREHAAAIRLTDWSAIDVQLYSFHTGAASRHAQTAMQPSEAVGSSTADIICQSWNRGKCSSPYNWCKYAHKCLVCSAGHRAADCQKRSSRSSSRRRSRSPSVSKESAKSRKR